MLDPLSCGIGIFNAETRQPLFLNDAYYHMVGYTKEEYAAVIADDGQKLIYPKDLPICRGSAEKFSREGSVSNSRFRVVRKNGEIRWVDLCIIPIKAYGAGCALCFFEDITEKNKSVLYQSLVDDSVTGIFVAEQHAHRIIYCNQAMLQIYPFPPGIPVIGKHLFDIIPQDAALLSDDEIAALPADHYTEFNWHNGDCYYNVRSRALRWNGVDSYTLYFSDETKEHQKHLEQAQLLNQVPVGIGIYEFVHGDIRQIYLNDHYYRMIGESRDARQKNHRDFLNAVYPDDLTRVNDLAKKYTDGSRDEFIDLRIMCGDGNYKWFRLTASVIKSEDDKLTLYCSFADIDKAVKTQEELKNANLDLQKQYAQEKQQLQMLEKDSVVTIQFNVTRDELIAYRINQGDFHKYNKGDSGAIIRSYIDAQTPTEAERRVVKDYFDKDKAKERFKNGIREFSAEYRRRMDNGRLCWIHSTSRMMLDEETGDLIVYTYMRDIDTERKKELTANSVIDEETDFVMLLNTVSNTAMLLRIKNDYQYFNERLYQEFPFKDALNMGELNTINAEDRPTVQNFFQKDALIERLKTETVITITYRNRYADGTIKRKKIRAFYLDKTHEDIVIARRDITDLYEEEQEQKRVLEAALEAATIASRSKSDFLSHMSHDLRTPMNVIIGSASLAMDTLDDPKEIEKALSNITTSSKYLLGLINDCLDIERINSGKVKLDPSPYPYIDFYNDIKAVIEPLCHQKNITLVMEKIEDVSAVIIADKKRIEQIFYNLLSNAIKFTPSGGTVEMLTRNMTVHDGMVSYDSIVRDNGIGMSEEFQEHMFDAFSQEENIISPEYQGTGLGLAIVKQLTDMMDAKITVKSKKNEGTEYRIHFTFPVASGIDTGEDDSAPVPVYDLHGKRVLLAEDHPLNRMIAQKVLEKAGMIVITAENGMEAVDRFKAVAENYFDAVLMDIRMPVMNGLDATRMIRALDRADARAVPIIAMTANAFDSDVKESLRSGMTAHLSKPIEPEKLYETLAKSMKRSKRDK